MLHRQHTAARPDGTIIVCSDMGTVERDTVQCVHCGCQWTIQSGSGKRRNFCTFHAGPTCGKAACDTCLRKERGMQIVPETNENCLKAQRKEAVKAMYTMQKTGEIIVP
ncbi:hypothetical protein LCGC14_1294410 [marine sediment metagenome]|uniref:Uncharacterized protein n=1 Tax=marine sediment metagenome TaxID=412755 RepID=A0A0F9KT88_9ZZZZ